MGRLSLILDNTQKTLEIPEGTKLFAALAGAGVDFGSNCGGHGICGKCKVKAAEGGFGPITAGELNALTDAERSEGLRLACHLTMPGGDCTIEASEFTGAAHILTSGIETEFVLAPMIKVSYNAAENKTIARREGKVLFEKDGLANAYALAVDIGTTTVVAYLLDLHTGAQLGVASTLNPQRSVGADVISRAGYSMNQPNGLSELSGMIREAITKLAASLCEDIESICHVTLAGNTIMMHIAAGLPVHTIAVAPYTPAYVEGFERSAEDFGWAFNPVCAVSLLPCIAGYVGADTIAAVMASGIFEDDALSLLIDIGTNGEMVLGNKSKLLACSTAAGPAFEGGHIQMGMGGVAGAINTVSLENGAVRYTTIGNAPPKGFCGSGLIDAAALLANEGCLDETGYLDGESDKLSENILEQENGYAFVAAKGADGDIYISQRDIREIQLAKGAIAAGIEILLRAWGVKEADVQKVYLAGGFGTYINYDSACTIGLIPSRMRERIISLGNAAGTGAKIAALSETSLKGAEEIRKLAEYIELAERPDFQDIFLDKMMF